MARKSYRRSSPTQTSTEVIACAHGYNSEDDFAGVDSVFRDEFNHPYDGSISPTDDDSDLFMFRLIFLNVLHYVFHFGQSSFPFFFFKEINHVQCEEYVIRILIIQSVLWDCEIVHPFPPSAFRVDEEEVILF